MDKLKISVVMPVYNRAFMLQQVVECLLRQSHGNIEIILVDDASDDDSYKVARQYPEIVALRHPDNRGPAAARNTGLRAAAGDVVLFIDSDVLVPPDLAEIHARMHLHRPRHIVQGQLVRIMDLKEAFRIPFNWRHYSRSFFDTANVSVRKRYLDETGGFDEKNFRKGWEDLDLGLRLRRRGLKVKRLYRRGCAWHYEGDIFDPENLHDFFRDRFREGQAAVVFYRKHPGLAVKLMTQAASPFFLWDKIRHNEEYYLSPRFHQKILSLRKNRHASAAVAGMRRAGCHFYLKGLRDKIREDGYLLSTGKRGGS